MAILARVLMLVASVPLLFPPGYCICKSGGGERVGATGHGPVVAQRTDSPARSPSGCCANRNCTGDHERRTPAGESKSRPGPAPQDNDHMPGCPAAAGADASKWVEPSQTPAHILPPLVVVVVLPVDVAGRRRPPLATPTNWPSSPPLYLSHCSLVI